MFTDFLGEKLKEGCDVVVNVACSLHSGIIHEVTDTTVRLSYNGWHDNGEEYEVEQVYTAEEYPDGMIDKICVI